MRGQRRLHHVVFAIMFATSLLWPALMKPVAAQGNTPLGLTSIAHGIVSPAGGTMNWNVDSAEAGTAETAEFATVPAGFVLVGTDAVIVSDAGTARADYVRADAAAFHAADAYVRVSSPGQAANYTSITLSTEATGAYTHAVTVPSGDHTLDLYRGRIATEDGDRTYTPAQDTAWLLHVTDGSITVVDDANETFTQAADSSLTVTGAITFSGAGSFVIAAIGEQVTVPPFPTAATGTLTVKEFDCPVGTDVAASTDACTAVSEPWAVTIHPSGRTDTALDLAIPDDSAFVDDGWTWSDMSTGVWYVNPAAAPEGSDFQIVVDGATHSGDNYEATIEDGKETVVSIYLIGERPTTDTALTISFLRCAEGYVGMTDFSGCTPDTQFPVAFTIERYNDQSVTFTEANATNAGNSTYTISGIQPGAYAIAFDFTNMQAADVSVTGSDVRGASGAMRYDFNVAGAPAEDFIRIAFIDTIVEPTETGFVSPAYFICSAESAAPADDANCSSDVLPYPVSLTNTETGEVYAMSSASAIEVPAGTYTVTVDSSATANQVIATESVDVAVGETEGVTVQEIVPPAENGTPPAD